MQINSNNKESIVSNEQKFKRIDILENLKDLIESLKISRDSDTSNSKFKNISNDLIERMYYFHIGNRRLDIEEIQPTRNRQFTDNRVFDRPMLANIEGLYHHDVTEHLFSGIIPNRQNDSPECYRETPFRYDQFTSVQISPDDINFLNELSRFYCLGETLLLTKRKGFSKNGFEIFFRN
jgi:hypothetical protein